MKATISVIMAGFLLLAGCSGMSATEQRVLSGGAIGAGGGALIGAAAGSAAIGAAVGGGAGLLAGYAYDQYQKSRAPSTIEKPRPQKRAQKKPARKAPEKKAPPDKATVVPHVM